VKRALMILAAGGLAIAACEQKPTETKPEESKQPTTTGATTITETTTMAPPVIVEADLSTPADFEESAEKAISKTNYKSELAVLEVDIAKE